jgi:DNA-binding NtrC family response regulator
LPARVEESVKGIVLVVGNEATIRWALRKTLQRLSFEVQKPKQASRPSVLVRTVRFCAVLLDISMPGMNGRETLQENS